MMMMVVAVVMVVMSPPEPFSPSFIPLTTASRLMPIAPSLGLLLGDIDGHILLLRSSSHI